MSIISILGYNVFSVQVIIEGSAPNNDLGDMAIDDIGFTYGCLEDGGALPPGTTIIPTTESPCPQGNFHCGNGDCIDNEKYCDGKKFSYVHYCTLNKKKGLQATSLKKKNCLNFKV